MLNQDSQDVRVRFASVDVLQALKSLQLVSIGALLLQGSS